MRERGVDFILAVGGGSVIDCCKVISAQAVLDEDIWEMEYQKENSRQQESQWELSLLHRVPEQK